MEFITGNPTLIVWGFIALVVVICITVLIAIKVVTLKQAGDFIVTMWEKFSGDKGISNDTTLTDKVVNEFVDYVTPKTPKSLMGAINGIGGKNNKNKKKPTFWSSFASGTAHFILNSAKTSAVNVVGDYVKKIF